MSKYDERLYPFQVEACQFIEDHGGRAILGDEQGLGKTVEALTWLNTRPDIGHVLVVVPANVTYKWAREVETWTKRKPLILKGYTTDIPKGWSVLICSYNVMMHRFREFSEMNFGLIMWDECHHLRGNRRKTKRVASALKLQSTYMMALSGTPFLNRPIELFNVLDMIQPGMWNLGKYGNRYCGGFDYWDGPLKGATNRSELKSKLSSVMIRRLKHDVLDDLPDISRIILPVNIRTADYTKALKEMNPANAMTKVMELWHIIGREKAKVAVEWVKDFFEQHEPNKKLVVYAHHLDVIDYMKEGLREYGAFNIDGRVAPAKRDQLITTFQSGSTRRVAIINKAGGEGIDLFGIDGVDASTIIFVERQWSPAIEEQAEGRLDRIGQRNPVTAYYLMALETYDPDMAQVIEGKRAIVRDVVGLKDIETTTRQDVINSL